MKRKRRVEAAEVESLEEEAEVEHRLRQGRAAGGDLREQHPELRYGLPVL